jgi:transposase
MKQVNFIKDLVEIKDKNITLLKELTKIDDDFIYLFAILDYAPPVCPNCGGKCIRYGFQRPSKYTYFPILNQPTLIILKKRRFQCQSCQKVFVAKTSYVKSNHFVPQDLIFKIGLLLNQGKRNQSII